MILCNVDSWLNSNNTCEIINSTITDNCMGRKGPQDCVSCNARFYLYSDPTQNITQCVNSCNSGYYLDSNNKICKPCSSNCISIEGK